MLAKIKFQFTKVYLLSYVLIANLLNVKWRKVEGIYLPFTPNIGFNTLRWIYNGQYECDEINIIKNKLEKTDTVLEIGTGLGFVSSYCAKIVGHAKVNTYEANPLNIDIVDAVFKKNNTNPNFYNALLANEDGETYFAINEKSRLASSNLLGSNTKATIKKLNLNTVISNIQPTFLIMDIEGGELDIFSIINFQTITKVQFELHPIILSKAQCETIFTIFKSNGFIKNEELSKNQNYFFYKL